MVNMIETKFMPASNPEIDLTKRELNVIRIVGERETITMTELSKRANTALSSMTNTVKKLVKKSYVVRERSEKDWRIVTVHLTDKGRKTYTDYKQNLLQISERMLSALDDREQMTFLRLFTKILQSMS